MTTTVTNTAAKKHLWTIDFLRAISAVFVLAFHYTSRYNEHPYIIEFGKLSNFPLVISFGGGAISVFFLMSGYLLAKYCNKTNFKIWPFLSKRFIRLYPTFWVCLILTTLSLQLLFPEIKISITDFIANLTMLPNLFGYNFVDGAYWTMACEIKFTVILSFILLIKNVNIKKFILWLWIIICIVNHMWIGNDALIYRIIRTVLIPDWAHVFICGICLYQIQVNKYKFCSWYMLLILSCYNQILWQLSTSHSIFLFCSILIIIALPYLERIRIPHNIYKPIEFVAMISYPLYLLHQMIGFSLIRVFQENNMTSEWWLFIPFGISICLAYYVHKFIEKPTSKTDFSKWPRLS